MVFKKKKRKAIYFCVYGAFGHCWPNSQALVQDILTSVKFLEEGCRNTEGKRALESVGFAGMIRDATACSVVSVSGLTRRRSAFSTDSFHLVVADSACTKDAVKSKMNDDP